MCIRDSDGRVVVGAAETPASRTRHAVVWIDGVPERIVPDSAYGGAWGSSQAVDVSGDGRLVLVNLDSRSPVITAVAAFFWDADNGLRRVHDVLRNDFRVDTQRGYGPGTALSPNGGTLVGYDGAYAYEGWVATLPEGCANALDDDGDGLVDLADPGCTRASDYSERGPAFACDDGIDNEGDGWADFPDDPSCSGATQEVEGNCSGGEDDDFDGLVDLEDPGCRDANDLDETDPMLPCDDGVDNDEDGGIDTFSDPGCASPAWPAEQTACSDELDNDGDGLVDWWEDPGCLGSPATLREGPRACGLGAELALVAPALRWLFARRRRTPQDPSRASHPS